MANILVVDDSLFLTKQIKEFLENNNHTVVGVGNSSQEGFEMYKDLKPDLVTLDLTMPNRSGFECLKDILSYDVSAKVVIVSAIKDKGKMMSCLEVGALDFIEKPLKFKNPSFCQSFINSIETALE